MTPAGSSERPSSVKARRAPASIRTRPDAPQREGDPQLAARETLAPCPHRRPHRIAGDRVPDDVGQIGRCDHHPHARPGGDLGRLQLARHSAAAPPRTGTTGDGFERGVDLDDLLDQRRLLVETGIGGEQPGRVGQHEQQLGADEVRDECREPVVVAVSDLVVGDGVVLVDHRDDTELEQPTERLAGVEVLRPVPEVVGREQHLSGDEVVLSRGSRRCAP